MVVNMLVDLHGVSFETPTEAVTLAACGVDLVNRQGASSDEAVWVKRNFRGRWHEESAAGWNWFAQGPAALAGFAAYGQHTIKFWWLQRWWDRSDVGIFGPMGVSKKLRGMGLGLVLARRALGSLQAMGFAHALIPAVGPVGFYERSCGARVVERLPRRLF